MTLFISVALGAFTAFIAFRITYIATIKAFGDDAIGVVGVFWPVLAAVFAAMVAIVMSTAIITPVRLSQISADDCPYSSEIPLENIFFTSDSHFDVAYIALDGTYQTTTQDNGRLDIEESPDADYHIISSYTQDDWMPKGCVYLLTVQVPGYSRQSESDIKDTLAKMRLDASGTDFIDVEDKGEADG